MSCSVTRVWQVYSHPQKYRSWQGWRLIIGNILALPKTSWPVFTALFQGKVKNQRNS